MYYTPMSKLEDTSFNGSPHKKAPRCAKVTMAAAPAGAGPGSILIEWVVRPPDKHGKARARLGPGVPRPTDCPRSVAMFVSCAVLLGIVYTFCPTHSHSIIGTLKTGG